MKTTDQRFQARFRGASRLQQAIALRDAALAVLKAMGKQGQVGNWPEIAVQSEPMLLPFPIEISLSPHPVDGHAMLSVWTPKAKVLNIEWVGSDRVALVNFRRGEWEDELLAMARAFPLH